MHKLGDTTTHVTAGPADRAGRALVRLIDGRCAGRRLDVLVVAAHPDDEIISAGALLRRLSRDGARIVLMHATDGAPRNGRDARAHGFASPREYARARRAELRHALMTAGVTCTCATAGIADQEAATALVPLATEISRRFQDHHYDLVLTHPFEGGHPDHDATAFAVHAARTIASRTARGAPPPGIVEFASYHLGPAGPVTGRFVPLPARSEAVLALTPGEQEIKQRARDCFVSQRATLALFDLTVERFRPAPRYCFLERPNDGRLLYELHDWGLDWSGWVEHVAAACRVLSLSPGGNLSREPRPR